MDKTVVFVLVLGILGWTAADPNGEMMSSEMLGEDLLARGLDVFEFAQKEFKEEGRDPLKKTLLPFLIGITLKAGTLVPAKLMVMTFIVVMALVFAKMGLAISALLGYLQYQESHKAKLAAVTDKWFIPASTHSTPIVSSGAHESLSSASDPQPAIAPAPASASGTVPGSGSVSGPASGQNPNKRLQQYQYDPYRYDAFNNDPYRFNRYDYPQH